LKALTATELFVVSWMYVPSIYPFPSSILKSLASATLVTPSLRSFIVHVFGFILPKEVQNKLLSSGTNSRADNSQFSCNPLVPLL
jgi:hypothetical protein